MMQPVIWKGRIFSLKMVDQTSVMLECGEEQEVLLSSEVAELHKVLQEYLADFGGYGIPKNPVIISQEKLAGLKKDSDFLNALEQAGVDNWGGYNQVWDILEGEED